MHHATRKNAIQYIYELRNTLIVRYIAAVFVSLFLLPSYGDFAEKRSTEIVNAFLSVIYGDTNENISVILITDDDLQSFSFPPPINLHAHYLSQILVFDPKALVIDTVFLDERGDDINHMRRQLVAYQEAGVPVIFAESTAESGLELREDLAALGDEGLFLLGSALLGEYQAGALMYPDVGDTGTPTLAALVAKSAYGLDVEDGPFHLWWRGNLNERTFLDAGDAQYARGLTWYNRVFGIASIPLLDWFFDHLTEYRLIKLRPFDTLEARLLSQIGDKAIVRSMIQGRTVFYGADFFAVNDDIQNPVFGVGTDNNSIDGIYHHAMALQNILDGRDRFRNDNLYTSFTIWLLGATLLFLTCLWLRRAQRRLGARTWAVSNAVSLIKLGIQVLIIRLVVPVIPFMVAAIYAVFCMWRVGISPAEWIALSLASWAVLVSWEGNEVEAK